MPNDFTFWELILRVNNSWEEQLKEKGPWQLDPGELVEILVIVSC